MLDIEKNRKEAENRMQTFLKGDKDGNRIQIHLLYEEAKNKFEEYKNDQEGWVKTGGSKKFKIQLFTKRVEVEFLVTRC